jgi:hypothetical protein
MKKTPKNQEESRGKHRGANNNFAFLMLLNDQL